MRFHLSAKTAKGRQQGIALLISLGILALMVVLAMGFASAAIFSQRNSRYSDDVGKARQICDTGMQRLVAGMKAELTDPTDFSTFFPGTRNFLEGTGDWAGHYYMVSVAPNDEAMTDGLTNLFQFRANGHPYYPNSLPNINSGSSSVSWLPVFETETWQGAPTSVLTGRMAYILFDESGKVDPNTIVSATTAEGAEALRGEDLSEINATDLGFSSGFAADLRPSGGSGHMPANGAWFSRRHVATACNASQSEVDRMVRDFFTYRRPDTLESIVTRFDLATVGASNPDAVLAAIPWLANWPQRGTYVSNGSRARQIAANLIDYSDTNRDATRDSTTTPTYFGLEQVPYLSRLQLRVTNISTSASGRSNPILQVTMRPELINMHGDLSGYSSTAYVRAVVEVAWTSANNQSRSSQLVLERNFTVGAAGTAGDLTANGYLRATTDSAAVTDAGTQIGSAGQVAIRQVRTRLVSVQVRKSNASDWWDWAAADYSTAVDLSAVGDFTFVHFKAYNPMNNFTPSDWASTVEVIDRFQSPYTAAGADCPDIWTTNPLFIRNNTMQHLVELGAIYRMEPYDAADLTKSFRTLNLVDYNYGGDPTIPAFYSDAEDGILDNYDGVPVVGEGNGGDRNILDMVRLGNANANERQLVGRININSQRPDVLRALFRRVTSEQYTGGAAIDSALIDTFVTNLMATTRNRPLPISLFGQNRNPPLYGILFQDTVAGALTQAQRAYLLMMSRELITSEHNYFSAIIVGQVIRDVGGVAPDTLMVNGVSSQLGRFDPGADRIMSTQRIRVVFYRNAFTNRVSIERYDYLDE
jgi:hypothetical protein